MPATYWVECTHCKGKGQIEVAREVWINRQICEKVTVYYKKLSPEQQAMVHVVLGGNNGYYVEQGRHIFTVDQLWVKPHKRHQSSTENLVTIG